MDQPADFLLRVEAVRFDAVIADTGDLSTVRGGGLLLLDAIEALAGHLRTCDHGAFRDMVDDISTGGSVGLFHLRGCGPEGARAVRAAAEAWLARSGGCRHAGEAADSLPISPCARFVCDIVPVRDDLLAARERAVTANRLHALRCVTVAMPAAGAPVSASARPAEIGRTLLCALDPTRPACACGDTGPPEKVDGREVALSQSVCCRRRHGRDAKRGGLFQRMQEQAGVDAHARTTLQFAQNFHDIADAATPYPALHGKIAMIYADGNGFTKRERAHVQSETKRERAHVESEQEQGGSQVDALHAFDTTLKELRAQLYLDVVSCLRRGGAWASLGCGPRAADGIKDCVKLEALLWGGDEFLWVVPASLGMAVTNFIVTKTDAWKLPPAAAGPPSHGVGLVFCHHDAPIQQVRRLAADLADTAKAVSRKRTLIAYEVMKSFDFPGRDLDEHRREWAPRGFQPRDLVLTARLAEALPDAAARLRRLEFPRRRLRGLAHRLAFDGAGTAFHEDQAAAFAAVDGTKAEIGGLLKDYEDYGPLLWFHLNALWDQLPPRPGTGTDEAHGADDAA